MQTQHNQDGITLLVTLLLMGVLLGVSTSLLNITLKQFQLSGIAYASETAFQAAAAGMECAQYYDKPKTGASVFAVPGNGNEQSVRPQISCMGTANQESDDNSNGTFVDTDLSNGLAISGGEQRFRFGWDNDFTNPEPDSVTDTVCTEISVYKYYSTTAPVSVTVGGVSVRPPSRPNCSVNGVCTVIQSRGYNVACGSINSGARVVERELTEVR